MGECKLPYFCLFEDNITTPNSKHVIRKKNAFLCHRRLHFANLRQYDQLQAAVRLVMCQVLSLTNSVVNGIVGLMCSASHVF